MILEFHSPPNFLRLYIETSIISGSCTKHSLREYPGVQLIPIPFSSVVLSCDSKLEVDFGTSSLTSHNICSRLMKKYQMIHKYNYSEGPEDIFEYTWKEDGFEGKVIDSRGLLVFFFFFFSVGYQNK